MEGGEDLKIVNRVEFLKLPSGIVYSNYQPHVFDGLFIKDDSLPNDFFTQNLIAEIENEDTEDYFKKLDSCMKGESVRLDFNVSSRDGCFDEEQMFAIYEEQDLFGLIEALLKSYQTLFDGTIVLSRNLS
jgi:hypothetical protein